MNNLTTFHYEANEIRTIAIDGEPWLVGKDVAEALGYANSRKALGDHVDEEDKGVTKCDTLGGVQELAIINESGLYSLIMSSKLPTAKSFKRWVTSEVLPSIRKTGGYQKDSNPDHWTLKQRQENARIIATASKPNLPHVLDALGMKYDPRTVSYEKPTPPILQKEGITPGVLAFLEEFGDCEGMATSLVYATYVTYCKKNWLTPLAHVEFSKQVSRVISGSTKTARIDGTPIRVFFVRK